MEFVEPDDGPPFRRPPSPDDRVWRHPSELGITSPEPPRSVSHRTLWLVAVVAAVGASVLSTGLVVAVGGLRDQSERTLPAAAGRLEPDKVPLAEPVVEIAERVRPAIIQIRAQRSGSGVNGSGFLFREDGHVLTNAHVVEGATSIRVMLAGGRELAARLIGADPVTDAAVVKIDGGPFPAVELGSAGGLKVGQTAVAIGSPLALSGGPSVTVGVVSALHRTVRTRDERSLFDMIQTDAPISPGSSGGALLDGAGRVIGMTTAIAVTDVGPEGLGFATPIDVARSVADELMATGRATHAWMGIEGNDLDGATAHDLDLDGGATVVQLREGGPAQQAGLEVRDIIVKIDGTPVLSMGTLVIALRKHRPGDRVVVEVIRDHQRSTRTLTLAERPASP